MRHHDSLGHIKLNNNLRMILRKAGCRYGDLNDLAKIIINSNNKTAQYAVSMNDILAVALAVEDEIIRIEQCEPDKKILLELYRIRYECINRCLNYLLENHEVSSTSFGKALLSYVSLHLSQRERDTLRSNGIEEISIPTVITEEVTSISNARYRACLHYTIEHFRLSEVVNSNSNSSDEGSLELTVFYDEPAERKDPRPIPSLYRRAKLDFNSINFDSIPLLENDSKTMLNEGNDFFNKLISKFNDRSTHMSTADIKSKMKLKSVMNSDQRENNFAENIKKTNGILVMRYHEDLYRMESKMDDAMLKHDYMFPDWAARWKKLSKYAHTASEYLPIFILNLKVLENYIDLFRFVIDGNEKLDSSEKAKYILRLLSYKDAISHERELIVESMLVRLELLGGSLIKNVVSGSAKAKSYYSNITHSSFIELMHLLGRNTPKIEEKFKRLNITKDEVKKFISLIGEYCDANQKSRLNTLIQDSAKANEDKIDTAIAAYDYDKSEKAAQEFQLNLSDGIINYEEIASYDVPDDVSLNNKIRQMLSVMRAADDLLHGEDVESGFDECQIMILCAIDSADAEHPEYLVDMLGQKWKEFTAMNRQLFRELFINKFYPDLQYKELIIRILDGQGSLSFHMLRVYINMIDLFNKMNKEYGGQHVLEMLSNTQIIFDQDKFKSMQVLMEYYRWLKDEVRIDLTDLERLSQRIHSPSDISKYNDVIGEIHLYNANNIDGACAELLNVLNKPVEASPIPVLIEEKKLPPQRKIRISIRKRFVSGLVGAMIGLFIVIISAFVFLFLFPELTTKTNIKHAATAVTIGMIVFGFVTGALIGKVVHQSKTGRSEHKKKGNNHKKMRG